MMLQKANRLTLLKALILVGAAVTASACDGGAPSRVGAATRPLVQPPAWAVQDEANVPAQVRTLVAPLLAANERVIHAVPTTVKSTGAAYYRIATFDASKQQTRKLTVDSAGVPVDFEAVLATEEAKHVAKYGKLAPALFEKLQTGATAPIRVQLYFPIGSLPPGGSDLPARLATVAAMVKSAGDPIAQALVARGATIVRRSVHSPVIEALLSPAEIQYWGHSAVEHIAESDAGKPVQYAAAQSTTDLELSPVFYALNLYGAGVRVGISREGANYNCGIRQHPLYQFQSVVYKAGPRTCTQHSDCTNACFNRGPGFCGNGRCNAFHGTVVAGAVGYVSGGVRHAPQVAIYSANDNSSHDTLLDWFWNNSVYVESESWAGLPTDLYEQDYHAMLGMTITEASNNDPDGAGYDCPASCHAANTICVAGYNSVANKTMLNMSCTANRGNCSVWTTGCDREEPHVVFRGGDDSATPTNQFVTTTNDPNDADGLIATLGTSVAAPGAAAFTALLFHRWGSTFKGYPAAVRAAMMASANKDIHIPPSPPTPPGKTYSDYRDTDERDGAGVPSADRVQGMMSYNPPRVSRGWLLKSSFDANHKKVLGQVYALSGQRIRAVLSWTGCPRHISDPYANGASVDLDLHLLDPSGNNVGNAASYDGTYEITEVVAATTGTYTFEAQYFGWESCAVMSDFVNMGFAYDVRQ